MNADLARKPRAVGFLCGWACIAEYLGVDEVTVWKWHQRHPLPVVMIGRRVRSDASLLAHWLLTCGDTMRARPASHPPRPRSERPCPDPPDPEPPDAPGPPYHEITVAAHTRRIPNERPRRDDVRLKHPVPALQPIPGSAVAVRVAVQRGNREEARE